MAGRPRRSSAPASTPTDTSSGHIALPHFVTDPVASLRPWPMDIRLGPVVCHIPPYPAADWLSVLMTEFTVWDLLPGMCPDDEHLVTRALLENHVTVQEFRDVCLQVITTAAGRPWWITVRLSQIAAANWESVGGSLAKSSIDASRISIGQWLDAVLLICLEGMKSEQTTMFLSQLEMPPPGFETEVKEMEMSVSAFMALR